MNSTTEILEEKTTPPQLASAIAADELPVRILERKPGWRFIDLGELWRYRELLYFLAWRDIKVRYKQTVLGVAWAVLQPLAAMIVLSLFFGRLAADPSAETPYPLFVFAGLLPWTFFANAISSAAQSVVGNQNLVTKIYFPRLIIPLAAVGACLVDFVIAFGMLLALMLYYGVAFTWTLALAPVLTVALALAATGIGVLLSALTVAYRDFRHVIPFMMMLWMFSTPSIFMQADVLSGSKTEWVLPLNPAYGLIASFRAAMLGGSIDGYALTVSVVAGLAMLPLGCLYFRRAERSFADII